MSDKLPPEPPGSEITSESLYRRRREFLKSAALFTGSAAAMGGGLYLLSGRRSKPPSPQASAPDAGPVELPVARRGPSPYDTDEPLTPYADVTTYNNFYEFGLDKDEPARNAHTLRPRPWTVRIEGEVHKPQTVDIDALLSWFPLEERVYRMRCVEAWSMVIPWLGFPLAELLKRVEPTSRSGAPFWLGSVLP